MVHTSSQAHRSLPLLLLAAALLALALLFVHDAQPAAAHHSSTPHRETLWQAGLTPLELPYSSGTRHGCDSTAFQPGALPRLGNNRSECGYPWLSPNTFTIDGVTYVFNQISKNNSPDDVYLVVRREDYGTVELPQALIDTGRFHIRSYVPAWDFSDPSQKPAVTLALADGHSSGGEFTWNSTSVGDWALTTQTSGATRWGTVVMSISWVPPQPANPPTEVSVSSPFTFREGSAYHLPFNLNNPAHREIRAFEEYVVVGSQWVEISGSPVFAYGATQSSTIVITPIDDNIANGCRSVVVQYLFTDGLRYQLDFTILDNDGGDNSGCNGRIGSAVPSSLTLEQSETRVGTGGYIYVYVLATLDRPAIDPVRTLEVSVHSSSTAVQSTFGDSMGDGADEQDFYIADTRLQIRRGDVNPRYTGSRESSDPNCGDGLIGTAAQDACLEEGTWDWGTLILITPSADDGDNIVLEAKTVQLSANDLRSIHVTSLSLTSNRLTLNVGQIRRAAQRQSFIALEGSGGSASEDGALPPPVDQDPQDRYADLIAKVKEWRNDSCCVNDKDHTDRWDRVLLTLGADSDSTLEPMTADEAQDYADRGWTRWQDVTEALRELESDGPQERASDPSGSAQTSTPTPEPAQEPPTTPGSGNDPDLLPETESESESTSESDSAPESESTSDSAPESESTSESDSAPESESTSESDSAPEPESTSESDSAPETPGAVARYDSDVDEAIGKSEYRAGRQ